MTASRVLSCPPEQASIPRPFSSLRICDLASDRNFLGSTIQKVIGNLLINRYKRSGLHYGSQKNEEPNNCPYNCGNHIEHRSEYNVIQEVYLGCHIVGNVDLYDANHNARNQKGYTDISALPAPKVRC